MPRNNALIFKVYGSPLKGFGHISRSLTLSKMLPVNIKSFFMVNDDEKVKDLVSGAGADVLGSFEDIKAKNYSVKTLFFDQPDEDQSFLAEAKKVLNCSVVALDYFNYESSFVDVIVNLFNHSSQSPQNCPIKYYEGLEFAIISSRFLPFRNNNRQTNKTISRILVVMGGADPTGKTLDALRFLRDINDLFQIDVVIGPLCEYGDQIHLEASLSPHKIHIHENPSNLPELMSGADIAFSGCATTFFELSFLGTPAIVMSQNNMEHEFCRFLDRKKLAIYARDSLSKAWKLIIQPDVRRRLMIIQMETIDGEGPNRILQSAGIHAAEL